MEVSQEVIPGLRRKRATLAVFTRGILHRRASLFKRLGFISGLSSSLYHQPVLVLHYGFLLDSPIALPVLFLKDFV